MRPALTSLLASAALVVAIEARAETTSSADDSSNATIAGYALLATGGATAAAGAIAYTALSARTPEECAAGACDDSYKTEKGASIVAMVVGGAGVAVSIPVLIASKREALVGKRKRSTPKRDARLVVGPAGVSLVGSF
jgi:hypothetical protein